MPNIYVDEEGFLHYLRFDHKSIADKLATPFTSYKDEIKKAESEGHILIEADDYDFITANRKAKNLGYKSETSGSAGFIFYDEDFRREHDIEEDSDILVINTGMGKQKTETKPVYSRLLRSAAIATAAVLLAFGMNYTLKEHQKQSLEREAMINTAQYAASRLGDNLNFNNMPLSDLYTYVETTKERMGGPAHFW